MVPPCSYQGGKQRIAKQIVGYLLNRSCKRYFDLACGSGSVSLELVNQGIPPHEIHMADKGPWGLFWKAIGEGSFDLERLRKHINAIPKDVALIQDYIKDLSDQPAEIDTIYVYLLLQAASFGSKAIWVENNRWMNCSFRSYWLPTATSNRRSPVNPMMPMPETLYKRVEEIYYGMRGVVGECADVFDVKIEPDSIVYIDPPYSNSTKYGDSFDVMKLVAQIKEKCFVSEAMSLGSKAYRMASTRKKGGISGERKSENEEWLTEFNTKESK